MMLFDGVLRPVITHSWKQSFHPSSFNDQQQGCLGLRELAAKGEKKKLSKSRELKWTPLEKIYFRIKRLMLGFHFVTAMSCGNKCQRAGGDLWRPSSITENYLLLPKVVFEPSGLHLICDWIMAVWHTPLMELSQTPQCSLSCGFEEALPWPGFLSLVLLRMKVILLATVVTLGDIMLRCQGKWPLSFDAREIRE